MELSPNGKVLPTPQILRVMKLMFLFLILGLVQVSARSQQVTLKESRASLEKVLEQIKKQSGYGLTYDGALLKAKGKPVDIDVKNMPVTDALNLVFRDQVLTYEIIGKKIISVKEKEIPKVVAIAPDASPVTDVHGVVKDESGKPAAGVAVQVKGTNKGTTTNINGEFTLRSVDNNAILVFTSVNLQAFEINLAGKTDIAVFLKAKVSELADVTITAVNTGYQQIPKERATGSFAFIDSTSLNRRMTTNILDRLEGITNGLIFNKNKPTVTGTNASDLTIRGRSTIYANPNPLIILDNFPYDGDLSTINPNDIESITILKDAAAASIWGAFSGNGVIVITSKKGRYNQPLKVSFNTNISIGSKPNQYYLPQLNGNDYVDAEIFLFQKGFYSSTISSNSRTWVTQAVETLARRKAGLISASDSASQIDALRNVDNRGDIDKYFYQRLFSQQYYLTLNGGNQGNQYNISFGFDKISPNLAYNGYQRYTVNAGNTYLLLNQKLELTANVRFAQSTTLNNNSGTFNGSNIPYNTLVDGSGNATAIPMLYRIGYVDTAGQGKLLDWHYKPLDELRNADNKTSLVDYHLRLNLKYKFLKGLDANIAYEYSNGRSDNENYQSQSTFYTRDLINKFSQINFTTGNVTRVFPLGGILDSKLSDYFSHQVRALLNYGHSWNNQHDLIAIAGAELKSYQASSYQTRLYGYNSDTKTAVNVDVVNQYPTYVTGASSTISSVDPSRLQVITRYISYFTNLSYFYKGRYNLTLSLRRDESNLFGVNANNKGVPLYSTGFGWVLSKEPFYNISWLPFVKLRASYGYNGNLDPKASSLLTTSYFGNSIFGLTPVALISNNPNAELRWERDNIINFGIDFAVKNKRISGSVEYFIKNGKDLLGNGLIAPQTGLSQAYRNIADMKVNGVDITINTRPIQNKIIQWDILANFSYAKDRITNYKLKKSSISGYVDPSLTLNPLEGYPLYSYFSYMYQGLDSVGNPQALLDGKISQNYGAITSSANFGNLKYSGPVNPTIFGNLMSTISYRQLSLSINLLYRLGHYFRRPSINYAAFFVASGGKGNPDYSLRWQKPGDEFNTIVPAAVYPNVPTRDQIFTYSDVLIEKADNVRLQDISLSYNLTKTNLKGLPFQSVVLYSNCSNIGILWKATKSSFDPDFISSMPPPLNISIGAKVNF